MNNPGWTGSFNYLSTHGSRLSEKKNSSDLASRVFHLSIKFTFFVILFRFHCGTGTTYITPGSGFGYSPGGRSCIMLAVYGVLSMFLFDIFSDRTFNFFFLFISAHVFVGVNPNTLCENFFYLHLIDIQGCNIG